MKKELKIPKFKNEDEERKFWVHVDMAEYFDVSDFQSAAFPNLKPSSRPVSLRIPDHACPVVKTKFSTIGDRE